MSDVIASKTVDVELEDPAGGTNLTFRVVEGQPVPDHLLEAYGKATGDDVGDPPDLFPGGDAEKAEKAPAKDKATSSKTSK